MAPAMNDQHRQRISAALKRYRASATAHELHQRGPDHPNWKGGVKPDYYRRIAFAAHGDRCLLCGAEATLVHHIDHDRSHNTSENLQPLCRTCHAQHHHGQRVSWICPVCGTVLQLRPFEAAHRVVCSRHCKEEARDNTGVFRALRSHTTPD